MTIKDAYIKIKSSDDLKKKAIAAFKEGKADEFFKENGFDITLEQIKEFATQFKKGELNRDELDMAAGGGCSNAACDWSDWLFSFGTAGFGCIVSGSMYLIKDKKDEHYYDCL